MCVYKQWSAATASCDNGLRVGLEVEIMDGKVSTISSIGSISARVVTTKSSPVYC